MALISDIAGSLDLGGGSLLLQVNQGEREPISILFVDEQRNPVSIRDWTFSVSTEFAYISLTTQDGRPVVSNFALSTSRQTTGTPTVSKSPLVPNQLDLLLPENLYTGTVPFNETRRVPSVVVYLRVQQGSEPTSPVDIMRWIVAMRRTSGEPISPDSPLTPQTPSGIPGQGLDREEVVALIAAPAREGSTERWALSKVPTLSDLGGLDQAAVDGRIMTLRPRIFTASDETKLDGIEENATADQTATEIKDSLETLSGNDRLSYGNLKDTPTIPTPRTDGEIDSRILEPARAGSATRWPANKVQTLAALGGVTSAQAVTIADTRASARFTTTEKNKLRDLPSASQLAFENHPIGSAAALNALSRTTSSLDFVTITGAISSGITANTVFDGSGTALTSLAAGDLLILDHDDNRWVRVVNLPTGTVVSQNTVRGFIDGDFVESLLAGLSGASRLSYNSLKDTPAIPAAQVPSDWDATTGVARILNKPTIPAAQVQTDWDATTGLGVLLNKPSLVTAFTGLSDTPSSLTGQGGKYAAVNSGATALEFVDAPSGGGESTARSFLIQARPSSNVTLAGTGNNTAWTAWTMIEQTLALTAAHAGNVLVAADFHVSVNTGSGGGDRCFTEIRLVRTRGSADTVLIMEPIYGPRNGGNFGPIGNVASKNASSSIVWHDAAMAGDRYKLEARVGTQIAGAKTFTFSATGNGLLVVPAGATYTGPRYIMTVSTYRSATSQQVFARTHSGGSLTAVVLPQSWFANTMTESQRTINNFSAWTQNSWQSVYFQIETEGTSAPANIQFVSGKTLRATATTSEGTQYVFNTGHRYTLGPNYIQFFNDSTVSSDISAVRGLVDDRADLPLNMEFQLVDA